MINLIHRRKNLGRRYLANVIDYTIFFAINFAYVYSVGTPNDSGGYTVTGFKTFFMPFVWTIYFPLCECIWGQTLAKKALDLHVVDIKGEIPSFGQTFVRRIVDFLELMTAGLLSVITISRSDKHQRVGDMLASTYVVSTSALCKFCSAEVELTPREVIKDMFICPSCSQTN